MAANRSDAPRLTEEEVALFCNAVGVAPRKLGQAAKELVEKYDLGQRGAWIIAMINAGANSPSRLSDALCIGRSLFTAELNRLVSAGLVETRKDARDGRRVQLALTREGVAEHDRLHEKLNRFVNENLAGFAKEDILLCARLLHSFAGSVPPFVDGGPSEGT